MQRFLVFLAAAFIGTISNAAEPFRLGIIGTTTSHVPAFVKLLNAPDAVEPFDKFKVVAAYRGGMPDNPDSWNRAEKYADELQKQELKLYPTVESMLPNVDGILLESVDGRPHLEQAKPVIAAGKPLFIDKPMAGCLADVLEIFRLADEKKVPVFSASSLRFASGFQKMRNEKPLGSILGCDAWSPCSLNAKHPDLFWYGVHGVETLFTLMGPGCETVARTQTDGAEFVVGVWSGGRIGTFRGLRNGKPGYGAVVFCEKGNADAGTYDGYKPLVEEICRFFLSGKAPFDPRETIEMFAFMEAADQSKAAGGKPVSVAEVLEKAKAEVAVPVRINLAVNGTITLNGNPCEREKLAETLDALAGKTPNSRVKVVLQAEKGTPHEKVLDACNRLGKAMLANYLYDID